MDFSTKTQALKQKIRFILFKYKTPFRIFAGLLVIILILISFFIVTSVSQKRSKNKENNELVFFKSAYVPDQLVVELKSAYTKSELELIQRTFDKLGVIGQQKAYEADKDYLNNFYILQFKEGTDLVNAKSTLDATGIIEASHPNYILTIQDIPNDQYFPNQWDMPKIGMPDVWNTVKGSNNITVAVIDTGIDLTHPDFAGRTIIKGPNYANCANRDPRTKFCLDPPTFDPNDDNGHGTHVAGTIGAVTNNGIGVAGMNWNVTLMAIKSVKADGDGIMTDNINAIQYAMANGVKVINMSLTSGKGQVVRCSDSDMRDLARTIQDAVSQGITVVVAAGNENQDASNEIPPSCPGVITVGATNEQDQRWPKSNYGSDVAIAAPGVDIVSTYKNGTYASSNGTSMAAPHVAGAAALLLSKKNMKPSEIKNCLVNNADTILTDQPIGRRLNVSGAVSNCINPISTILSITPQASPSPTIVSLPNTVIVENPATPIYSSPNTSQPPIAQANPQTPLTVIGQTTTMYNVQLNTGQTGWVAKTSVTVPSPTTALVTNAPTKSAQTKTYTCRQAKGFTPTGAIQIGNLICTPN